MSEFRKRAKSSDGLTVWCKKCFADYDRERYANGDKERKRQNKVKRIEANKKLLLEYLMQNPCVDCGNDNPIVLEFDHKDPATKSGNVCEMLSYGWATIRAEIGKCEVRCANCHRIRTHGQFGFWK